jgi:hypothetical protein
MVYEKLIDTFKQENKSLVSEEMKRRKTLLDKMRSASTNDFEDVYRQEKEKLENKQKLM